MGKYILLILGSVLSLTFFLGTRLENNERTNISVCEEEELKCTDCHSDLVEAKVVHSPIKEDCTTCHTPNGPKHPDEEGAFTIADKTPELCYMCHDALNEKKTVHAPVASGECTGCHSPHSSANSKMLQAKPEELCMTCHEAFTGNSVHAPVAGGECASCHNPHQSDNSKLLVENTPGLCYTCHEPMNTKMYIHAPVADGMCSMCHAPHASQSKSLLTNSNVGALCAECHETGYAGGKTAHKPYKSGECASCHNPHQSDENGLLKTNDKDICLTCHSKVIKGENRTIKNIGLSIKGSKSVHGIIETDGCTSCHSAHFSEYNLLLVDVYNQTQYAEANPGNFALCFNCHDAALMTEKTSITATGFRNAYKNLHAVHVSGPKARNCNVCHNIHGSKNEHLIESKVPFGKWEMDMNFVPTDKGGGCLPGCHQELNYDRTMTRNDSIAMDKLLQSTDNEAVEIVSATPEDALSSYNTKAALALAKSERSKALEAAKQCDAENKKLKKEMELLKSSSGITDSETVGNNVELRLTMAKLETAEKEKQELLNEKENLEAEIQKLKSAENHGNNNSSDASSGQLEKAQAELKELKNKVEAEAEKSRNLQSEIDRLNALNNSLTAGDNSEALRSALEEARIANEKVKLNQQEIEKLNTTIETLKSASNTNTTAQSDEMNKMQSDLKKKEEELKTANTEIASLRKELEATKEASKANSPQSGNITEINTLKKDLDDSKNRNTQLEIKIEELSRELTTLKGSANTATQSDESAKQVVTLKDENYRLKSQVKNLEQQIDYLKTVSNYKETTSEVKEKPEGTLKFYRINFDFESSKIELEESIKMSLSEIITYLNNNPKLDVEIHGHTDNSGDPAFNLKLSEERAQRVKEYLVELGIKAERISVIGYGDQYPIMPNDTREGRVANRRVEFKLIQRE